MGGVGAGREPVQGPPCLGAPSSGPSLLCPRGTHKPLMDFCWPACPQGAGLLLGAARPGPPLLLPSAHDKELQREHRSSLLQVLRNKRVPVSLRTMPLPHRVAGPSEHQCSPPGAWSQASPLLLRPGCPSSPLLLPLWPGWVEGVACPSGDLRKWPLLRTMWGCPLAASSTPSSAGGHPPLPVMFTGLRTCPRSSGVKVQTPQ